MKDAYDIPLGSPWVDSRGVYTSTGTVVLVIGHLLIGSVRYMLTMEWEDDLIRASIFHPDSIVSNMERL